MIPHLYIISLFVLDVAEREGWVEEIEGTCPFFFFDMMEVAARCGSYSLLLHKDS